MPAIAVLSAARTTPSGTYLNAGDELLTRRLVAWLQREAPDARVVRSLGGAAAPGDGGQPGVERLDPRDLHRTWRIVRRSDLVVIGGGTLLQSDGPRGRAPAGMVRYLSTVSALCRLAGTPHVLAGVGVELPADRRDRALLVAAARGADACLVRDAPSAEELTSAGVAATICGDVYLLPPSPPPPVERERVGIIAPRADLTERDVEQIAAIVAAHPDLERWDVVAMHRDPSPGGVDDLHALGALGPALAGRRWRAVDATERPGELPARLAAASACIAMRLHAAYVALDAGTPLTLVGEAPKVRRLGAELAAHGDDAERWRTWSRTRLTTTLRAELIGRLPAARPEPALGAAS